MNYMGSETLPSTYGVIRRLRLLPFLSVCWTQESYYCSFYQVQVLR